MLSAKEEDAPQPARRRRGETGKGFAPAWRTMLRRAARTDPAARGRYAGLRTEEEPKTTADIYASAAMYLSDILDWLNLWQDNDNWPEDDFSAKQYQNYPQF